MKILFLASRFPYPPKSGRESILMQRLESFNSQGNEIYLYAFDKEFAELNLLNEKLKTAIPSIEEIVIVKLPSILTVGINLLLNVIKPRQKCLQECLFYSKAIQKAIAIKLDLLKPDIIFCDMVRTAQFIEHLPTGTCRRIFDMDDMLSKRYKRLLNVEDEGITGNFSGRIPFILKIITERFFRKIILKMEARLIEKREEELTRNFDATILVSPIESEELKKKVCKQTVYYVYPAAKMKCLSRTTIFKDPFSLSFMGLLNYMPNEKGLVHFLENIFPYVIDQVPNIRLHIIGANATKKIKALAASLPHNIILAGFVEDLLSYLSATRAFVAPVYCGTGIKTKIIDAMSIGLPVITTEIGAEGLKARPGTDLLVASDDAHYAQLIIELINNEELCNRIGHNARKYIDMHHDPQELTLIFNKICNTK